MIDYKNWTNISYEIEFNGNVKKCVFFACKDSPSPLLQDINLIYSKERAQIVLLCESPAKDCCLAGGTYV